VLPNGKRKEEIVNIFFLYIYSKNPTYRTETRIQEMKIMRGMVISCLLRATDHAKVCYYIYPEFQVHQGAFGQKFIMSKPYTVANNDRMVGEMDLTLINGCRPNTAIALFAWLISHQPAVLFSHNNPAPAISHQPTQHVVNREQVHNLRVSDLLIEVQVGNLCLPLLMPNKISECNFCI
jgi:hypothetical protein